jgi:hypothetical protein
MLKMVGNCSGMTKSRSVGQNRAITVDNESGQPKMAESACCLLKIRVIGQNGSWGLKTRDLSRKWQ